MGMLWYRWQQIAADVQDQAVHRPCHHKYMNVFLPACQAYRYLSGAKAARSSTGTALVHMLHNVPKMFPRRNGAEFSAVFLH